MDFSRQISLIGSENQKLLSQKHVLVLGAGGLGSFVAAGLAMSGLGRLTIVDYDQVGHSNLHRQFLYDTTDIGQDKVSVLAKYIKSRNSECHIEVHPKFLDQSVALRLFPDADLIVDCLDHMPSKYLANDMAVKLDKPLVYGSLYKYDAYWAMLNVKGSAQLRDFFPESEDLADLSCAEVGILNPIVNLCAAMQVNLCLNYLLEEDLALNQMTIFNIKKQSSYTMRASEIRKNHVSNPSVLERNWAEFDPQRDAVYSLIDHRIDSASYSGANNEISLEDFLTTHGPNRPVFVYCKRGITSLKEVKRLKQLKGNEDYEIYSIRGGIQSI